MTVSSGSLRTLRLYLALSGVAILAWVALLVFGAAGQVREIGRIGGTLAAAIVAGTIAVLLTPLAWRSLLRFEAASLAPGVRPFSSIAAYYRVVALVFFVLWLALIFGTRKELPARLASHLLWGLAGHRLLLCFPGLLQRAVAAILSRRALRIGEILFTNVMIAVLLAEVALRSYFIARGGLYWISEGAGDFGNKQRAPIFGLAPNSMGYNDREFVQEKAAGAVRIAAVGDSFFVAHVPRALGVIARTEEHLRAANPQRLIEIYNFGIVATSPYEYVEVARREVLAFRPDFVLVGIYVGNDIRLRYETPSPLEKRWYALYQVAEKLAMELKAYRATTKREFVDLTQITESKPEFWTARENIPQVHADEEYLSIAARHVAAIKPGSTALCEEEWRDTLAALAEMKALCAEAGVRLLMVIHPDHVQVSKRIRDAVRTAKGVEIRDEDLNYPQSRLLDFFVKHGIPSLDLLPAFLAAAGDPDHLYLAGDNHWSALGNEVAARTIARWLEAELEAR